MSCTIGWNSLIKKCNVSLPYLHTQTNSVLYVMKTWHSDWVFQTLLVFYFPEYWEVQWSEGGCRWGMLWAAQRWCVWVCVHHGKHEGGRERWRLIVYSKSSFWGLCDSTQLPDKQQRKQQQQPFVINSMWAPSNHRTTRHTVHRDHRSLSLWWPQACVTGCLWVCLNAWVCICSLPSFLIGLVHKGTQCLVPLQNLLFQRLDLLLSFLLLCFLII